MFLTIIIAFLSLMGLMVLHEFGHFLFAKKFGLKVEEFGVGYPPRLFAKKIGDTVYSLNLLPFGAFVKIPGETGKSSDPWSFSGQPIYKRVLIVLGGVISFWVVAAVIFTFVFRMGVPSAVSDDEAGLADAKVQILEVAKDSPAEAAGLETGDVIRKLSFSGESFAVDKTSQVQEFTASHLGREIVLTVGRGEDVFDVSLVARQSPPEGQGAMGVALSRVAVKSYPWHLAPVEGVRATAYLTHSILRGYAAAIGNVISGAPSGVQLTGPVGVFHMLSQAQQMGLTYYLNFIAMISVYLAIFNLLPIPAVDGGKLVFLVIEAVRKKPVPARVEQAVTAAFFALLLILMVVVTVNDISRIF